MAAQITVIIAQNATTHPDMQEHPCSHNGDTYCILSLAFAQNDFVFSSLIAEIN
jgi:hypothetical protein